MSEQPEDQVEEQDEQDSEPDEDIGVPAGVHNPQFVPMPGEDQPVQAPDPEAEDDGPRVEHRDDETGDEGSSGDDEGAARPLTEASPGSEAPGGTPPAAPTSPGGAGTTSKE